MESLEAHDAEHNPGALGVMGRAPADEAVSAAFGAVGGDVVGEAVGAVVGDAASQIGIRAVEPCAPMHVNLMPPRRLLGSTLPESHARSDPRLQRAREMRLAELLLFFTIRNEDVPAAAALLASGPVVVGEPPTLGNQLNGGTAAVQARYHYLSCRHSPCCYACASQITVSTKRVQPPPSLANTDTCIVRASSYPTSSL